VGRELYLGLISGTSADGIDAALVDFSSGAVVVAAASTPYPDDIRKLILRTSQVEASINLDSLGELDARVGTCFANAASSLLDATGVPASRVMGIGSHGQTLRHNPSGTAGFTLQIGDASRIAERTGISTVHDFRRRDVAAGGQGAPLVPAFHSGVFADPREDRAVLNLGGIANLTLLPRAGHVLGFDTGPANALLDAWCLRHLGYGHDEEGQWASSGSVLDALLGELLADAFFDLEPPKSTGRDRFHLEWLLPKLAGHSAEPADVQATLVELTARSIAQALRRWQPATSRVLACGGGVHNRALMQALERNLAPATLQTTAALGLDPDFVEAAAFAWLARETLAGRPGNIPSVTGARGPRILGSIIPA